MPPTCDECGSHDVAQLSLEGRSIEECGLCGNLQGQPASVAAVLEARGARELDIPLELYGLVQALGQVPGLHLDQAISIVPGLDAPPALFFTLREQPIEVLDRLTRSLVLARRRLTHLWTVEATHQGKLLFVLRPRLFHASVDLDAAELRVLMQDVAVLRDALRRDLNLPWWELPR